VRGRHAEGDVTLTSAERDALVWRGLGVSRGRRLGRRPIRDRFGARLRFV